MATPAAQPCQSSEDWQTTKETVRDRTAFLFNNSLLSDIKFVVTDSQDESNSRQVRIPAHKFVLAISSPVFEAMFYGQMAEKGEEVELPDTDSRALLGFLRFVYCEEVNLTIDNVLGVVCGQEIHCTDPSGQMQIIFGDKTRRNKRFSDLRRSKEI